MLECKNGMFGPSRRIAADHVYMTCFAVSGIERTDGAGDVEPPVSALGNIFVIAEGEHEFVARLGVLGSCETASLDGGGEAVVGERGRDDVEGGSARGREEGENMLDFYERSWPCTLINTTNPN